MENKKNTRKEIISTLLYVLFMLVAVYLVITFVGQRTVVNGESMEPTLQDGDNLILDKISYRFHDPERFDIVVFPGPEENGVDPWYIKRVIGLPGETVQIKSGSVYVNGTLYEEKTDVASIEDAGMAEDEIKLGDGEYFVLGDNRNSSEDSRYANIGNVKEDYIVGKAWFSFKSISHMGFID